MARLPQHIAEKAREEAERWEQFKDGATFASAGLVPAIIAVAGTAVGAVCGAASASMVMLGSRKIRAATRKANDPPDENFTQPVHARRAHFNEDAFGFTPIERATVRASYGLLYSTAYDLATVRAVERADGAREANEPQYEAARLAEARKFANRSIEAAEDAYRGVSELCDRLLEVGDGRLSFDASELPKRLDLALPDETLIMLFRAGFRIEELRLDVPRLREVPEDALEYITRLLSDAGSATAAFGRELRPAVDEVFAIDAR